MMTVINEISLLGSELTFSASVYVCNWVFCKIQANILYNGTVQHILLNHFGGLQLPCTCKIIIGLL